MKKLILSFLIVLSAIVGAYAQFNPIGTVSFDSLNANPAATLSSTSFGLVFTGTSNNPIPLNQNINLALLGGPNAGSLSLIAALTFANGLAQGDNTLLQVPGAFQDPSGAVYSVPGVPGGGIGFFEVEAWLGNDVTYAQAVGDLSPNGSSGIYSGFTGNGGIPPSIPVSIGDGMPSFLVTTPEPTTLALCGLGAASLLLLRRKK
jgi:hypothetical protein